MEKEQEASRLWSLSRWNFFRQFSGMIMVNRSYQDIVIAFDGNVKSIGGSREGQNSYSFLPSVRVIITYYIFCFRIVLLLVLTMIPSRYFQSKHFALPLHRLSRLVFCFHCSTVTFTVFTCR